MHVTEQALSTFSIHITRQIQNWAKSWYPSPSFLAGYRKTYDLPHQLNQRSVLGTALVAPSEVMDYF